ncbi:sensor histidine kinase [Actinomadura sp. KC216]|uniref:sensor histidine kinase n=1 Tax=Actinomadura sp. KC216 TaxID=2530370 RepID=UPI00104A812A|nr:sensor histidine kinase [Actinomadura sp. KC216]TDB79543.1 sensor histidine kinase [Actinomadura sp. KC216]
MPALTLSRVCRVRRLAWAVVLWSATILYPFVLVATVMNGTNGFVGMEVFVSALLTVLVAALLQRHPLPGQGTLLLAWTWALLQMPIGGIAALQIAITDLGVGYIAATRRHRVSVPVLAVTLAVQALSAVVFLSPDDFLLLIIVLAVSVTWLAGNSIQVRRANAEMMRVQATAQAVAAERLRIARELHDMVAHSIGIIAIQAGVGGRVIDTQPAEARNALDAIEATSRDVLSGLRRMLTALRKDDPGAAPLGPSPGLDDLDRLAESTKDAGVRVDVRWKGERRPLPPDVDLSAYRIVQEAVTNVVRHAGTPDCRVTIEYGDEEVSIEVEDDGRGGVVGTGYGIVGMRERVGLLGGEFAAGPRPDGGFRVAARIPAPETAAVAAT